eukprot:110561_1
MSTSCCHTNTVTNTDEERNFLLGKPTDKPPILRIDDALAQYYKDCGRNDYFNNESRQGKFMKFTHDNQYDTDELDDELGDNANDPNDCYFVRHIDEIDPMFPLPISTNESRANDIFQVFKHCYKYGVAPLSLIWQYVANALKHELYDKIASAFMVLVNESN